MFLTVLGFLRQLFFMISYITNANSFPKPLSAKAEQHYLTLYEQGDGNARNVLIEHNLRLVAHVAKKYSIPGMDSDDLISIGTIGLIKGINSFNSSRGTRLSTYIARCIENEILMCIRTIKKTKNEVSIEEPIGFDKDGNQITFNDVLGSSGDEIIEQVNEKMEILKLYEGIGNILEGREKQVLELRYGLRGGCELTQKEVAKILNISRSYVSRIEKKAIERLKKKLITDCYGNSAAYNLQMAKKIDKGI
ncbi:MAG: RNA polymerase sporulation sigma factor SigK [Firmicutes bacterium]|nr:RNA polymerase sporulation sigma factor SigK [Bacillota bacterium]